MNFFVKLDKDSEPKSGGSAPGRREKVEKFVVHIDENNIVKRTAEKEGQSFNEMLHILLREALERRELEVRNV